MLSRQRLESFLNQIPRLRLGLVGDLFLDRYLELAPGVAELSIETGLEAYQVPRVRNAPGALGTVMNNLAALGVGHLVPVTVIGNDGHGFDLLAALRSLPATLDHVIRSPTRLTPTYTKPMRPTTPGLWQELNRLDIRSREPLADAAEDQLLARIETVFLQTDGLIVLDQVVEENWGVVNVAVRELLAQLARRCPEKLMFVDSRAHLGRFTAGVLKGNQAEILRASPNASALPEPERLPAAAQALARQTGSVVFCTQGNAGMVVAQPTGAVEFVNGYPVSGPVDIVGAGDAATSGLVTSLLCGATPAEAAVMGNLVASITVQQLGATGTASPAQVRERWREYTEQHQRQ